MDCGGSTHMQQGGVPPGYHMMPDGSMMPDNQMQQGGIPQGNPMDACTGENFGGPNCPQGSPQYEMAKNYRSMAAKREKKDFTSGTAEQNMSTNDINAQKNNLFKDYISQNAMDAISQEEMLSFAGQQQQQMMNPNFQIGGGVTNAPGYVGNPQLDMYVQQQQELGDLTKSTNDALFGAIENSNFNRELTAKTKFLKNDLGKQMKQEYKDLNKQYKHMNKNPLDAYQQMIQQQQQPNIVTAQYGGTMYPMFEYGGAMYPLPQAQAGLNVPVNATAGYIPPSVRDIPLTTTSPGPIVNNQFEMPDYQMPDYSTQYDPLYDQRVIPGLHTSDETGGIGASMFQSGFLPAYSPQGLQQWYPAGSETPVVEDPVYTAEGAVTDGVEDAADLVEESKKKKTATVTEEPEKKESTIATKETKTKEPVKGNVNPNEGATDGNGNTPATTQGGNGQGVQTPYGVVYPNVGGFGQRGKLPFYYNPGDITKTEIETRRALFKGNRPKKITFTHGLPQQQAAPVNQPANENLQVEDPEYTMWKNKKNAEEVSASLKEGLKPSADAVEVQGIDPNQSVFSENGPNSIMWQSENMPTINSINANPTTTSAVNNVAQEEYQPQLTDEQIMGHKLLKRYGGAKMAYGGVPFTEQYPQAQMYPVMAYGGVPFHEMYPQAVRYPVMQEGGEELVVVQGGNPNANASGRYIQDFQTRQVNPHTVVDYEGNNPDGTIIQEADPVFRDRGKRDAEGNVIKQNEYFTNQGTVSDVNLKNNTAVEFKGNIEDHKKMLKKLNRANFMGSHGFRGKNWKNDVQPYEGQTKEEAIAEYKEENPFFERGRKRVLEYDLNPGNNKSAHNPYVAKRTHYINERPGHQRVQFQAGGNTEFVGPMNENTFNTQQGHNADLYPNGMPQMFPQTAPAQPLQGLQRQFVPFQNVNTVNAAANANAAAQNKRAMQKMQKDAMLYDQNERLKATRAQYPQYQQGGEYDLTDDEIQYILANGGSVDYL